jgi:integrase
VNRFDVSVYAIRRRAGRRRPFEVRWRAAGRSRSKSFITRKLADSYRAELVRAARTGLEAAAQILEWARQASLPVGCLSEPAVLRTALEALTLRLDGTRAAANTIIRKRAVLHGALGYAAEAGLLPDNPLDSFGWQVPRSPAALDPAVVASPAQVSALLDAVTRTRPEITAFFGCLYYAALRPEEAVALRLADCHLPGSGWGMLRLAVASPRTAAVWTSSGTSHEQRGLKHRPDGAIRIVPVRPYDLRHAARAGHSVAVLLTVYSHCIHGQDDLLNQQIDHVLEPSA